MKKENMIKLRLRAVVVMTLGVFCFHPAAAQSYQQEDKKLTRETNELLRNAEDELAGNDFPSAEASYRQAVAKKPGSVTAKYNMANMYYGKEKPGQAASRFKQAAEVAETKLDKHRIFHNLGNSYMTQKNYKEAVEAYKDALRNNPSDEETRYNLALAKKMLEKEDPESEDGDGDQDQENKDQNKDDQSEGDQGDKDQDKQEGEDENEQGEDQNEDPQNEPGEQDENGDPKDQSEQEGESDQQDEPQPQQPQPGQLSPQQIKNLLEAMNNEERKVQDKINAEKAKGAKTTTGKDW